MSKSKAIVDIETYRNYFLICFTDIITGRRRHFEMYDGHPLDIQGVVKILRHFTLISFNGNTYDMPMLRLALRMGTSNATLKMMSDRIIQQNMKPWDCEREFNLVSIPWLDHIDLIEPAPSVQVGLKLYGGRLHSKRLQDLPIEPSAYIEPEQRIVLVDYCYNDCDTTHDVFKHIEPQINLRVSMGEQFGLDLRSKSDAQISEAVIKHELERISGDKIYRPEFSRHYQFKYAAPQFLRFTTPVMQDIFDLIKRETFTLANNGSVEMPASLKSAKIKIGKSVYRMGIGGLHSSESVVAHFSDDEFLVKDADVSAFYPRIILVCGLYPEHLGPAFLDVYRSIFDRRISAKARIKQIKKLLEMGVNAIEEARLRGDLKSCQVIDMTLKIVLNGCFGKLGSPYSFLYSPNLMIQVTVTGQLVLLMLIEALENAGIQVVSANTDGIVSKIPRDQVDEYHDIIQRWEKRTGFEMEFAEYDALYSRDVNNYIAVKPDGTVKQKGTFAFVGSKGSPAEKNPANYISTDAVIAYLTKGTPLMETIEWCPDMRRFLTVRRVTGGATYDGQYLGKTVRWYYARGSKECIRRATNGDKVARSDGCKPLMELTGELPNDIDYQWYFNEAVSMLGDLGVL